MKNIRFFNRVNDWAKETSHPMLRNFAAGVFAVLAFTFTACSDDFFTQTIPIDPPAYTKQLSFHLNLSDRDTVAEVLLTRNFGILETVPNQEDFYVNDGIVELYKDGQKWLTLAPKNSNERHILVGVLPEPLQSGSSYEIRAEHPDYPKVSAVQAMPDDFVVDSARIKRDAISGQFGDKFDLIDLFLKDEPGVRNYYEVSISGTYFYELYDPNTGMTDTIYTDYPVYIEDFTDPNAVYGVNGSGLFSDQFFDGQSYKFQLQVYSYSGSKFTVHVRSITEEYYKWSRSYQAKYDADENPLVEPVSVFSNLVDGLGIFSVSREKVYIVE